MINHFQLSPGELDPFRSGPLGPHIDRWAGLLSEQGYPWQTSQDQTGGLPDPRRDRRPVGGPRPEYLGGPAGSNSAAGGGANRPAGF